MTSSIRLPWPSCTRTRGGDKEAIQILEAGNAFLKEYAPLQPVRVAMLLDLAGIYRKQGDVGRSDDLMAKARRLNGLLEGPPPLKEEKKNLNLPSPR